MDKVEDILTLLRNGATEEEIAEQLSEALNTAVQMKKEEDAAAFKAEQDRKSQERKERSALHAAKQLRETLWHFFDDIGALEVRKCLEENDVDAEIANMLITTADIVNSDLFTLFREHTSRVKEPNQNQYKGPTLVMDNCKKKPIKATLEDTEEKNTVDKAIQDFLRALDME